MLLGSRIRSFLLIWELLSLIFKNGTRTACLCGLQQFVLKCPNLKSVLYTPCYLVRNAQLGPKQAELVLWDEFMSAYTLGTIISYAGLKNLSDEKRKRKIKIFVSGHSCAFTMKSVLIALVKTKTEILNSRFRLDYPSLWEDKKRRWRSLSTTQFGAKVPMKDGKSLFNPTW